MKENKMNSQQWMVYNLLKKGEAKATTICGLCGYEYDQDAKERNLARISQALYNDVNFINQCPEVEKKILWKVEDGVMWYWLARNLDEVFEFVERVYLKSAKKAFKKAYRMMKECAFDGQMKMVSLRGNVIDDKSKARNYVEAFLKGVEDEE